MSMEAADVIIAGRGALAMFAAQRARQAGLKPLVVGSGRPFERFLLLHENALRVLEAAFGTAPGHPLRGVRVLDRSLGDIRRLDFARRGLRLHAMRHSALLDWLERRSSSGVPVIDAEIATLSPNGALTLRDGRTFRAGRMVLNTVAALAPRRRLRVRHRKVFRMGFITGPPEQDWVVQINDRSTYAILVPFGADAAVVSSGDPAPLFDFLGMEKKDLPLATLKLETWCGWSWQQGRIVHVGEAVRRVHPHTAQGLNRALDAIDALFAGRSLLREKMHDCLVWAGGVLLDAIWGGPSPALIRGSLALLGTGPGLALASGTLLQRRLGPLPRSGRG